MSKMRTAFFCSNCGYESAKWLGKCPSCEQWNCFVEEVITKDNKLTETEWKKFSPGKKESRSISLQEVVSAAEDRIISADAELNRVLGGGIVAGSIVLVAGEPGIGKSTLFLQNGLQLPELRTLYISGEESEQQIKMRADRLNIRNDEFYLLTETSTQIIFQEIRKLNPRAGDRRLDTDPAVSLHRIFGRQRFADQGMCLRVPAFCQGDANTRVPDRTYYQRRKHCGPKVLEHMVDTVLQFEGDRHYAYRILRTLKNRFGSTAELGIYEMTEQGMRGVSNPSELLITQREEQLSGVAIAATIEGLRPLLIEVQALVTQSVYGTPQRTVSGFDLRRLQLLLAVLEKRGGFHFGVKDVFLNIAGGLKVEDPSIDLAVLCALLSSYEDAPLSVRTCFAGEVGLSGEIRAVNRIDQRIAEAEKLGFERIFVSKYNQKGLGNAKFDIEVVPVGRVEEVYQHLF